VARIPDVEDFGARPAPQARVPRTVDQSGAILGEAMEGTARRIGAIAGDLANRREEFQATTARSALLQADIAARKSLENDLDFTTHEARYRESMQKALDSAGQGISGRRSKTLFQEQGKLDLERGLVTIR
jgi:hypothetical protein